MSEEEIADVRAIALIRLAREFQEVYEKWMMAWAEFQSHKKARKLLKEADMDGVSEDVKDEIRRAIEDEERYAEGALDKLGGSYLSLRRLEREIKRVLGKPWEWRDGSEGDAVWRSRMWGEETKCSE